MTYFKCPLNFCIVFFYLFSVVGCATSNKTVVQLTPETPFTFQNNLKYSFKFKNGVRIASPGSALSYHYPLVSLTTLQNSSLNYSLADMNTMKEHTNRKKGRYLWEGLAVGAGAGTAASIPFFVMAAQSDTSGFLGDLDRTVNISFGISSILIGSVLGLVIGALIRKKEKVYYTPPSDLQPAK